MIKITEEQKTLVADNHSLIYSFMSKYQLNIDEHYGLAAIGLCKAAITYDGNKSKFLTYAYKCMFNSVMHELRKDRMLKRIPNHMILHYDANFEAEDGSVMSFLDITPSNENTENTAMTNIMVCECMNSLPHKDKQILFMLYNGYSQTETGKIIGCSQAQVSRIKTKLKKLFS